MIKATDGEPRREFVKPDDIYFEIIDPDNGCKASGTGSRAIKVALRKGQEVCEEISPAAAQSDVFP